jgi:hypothetical protein
VSQIQPEFLDGEERLTSQLESIAATIVITSNPNAPVPSLNTRSDMPRRLVLAIPIERGSSRARFRLPRHDLGWKRRVSELAGGEFWPSVSAHFMKSTTGPRLRLVLESSYEKQPGEGRNRIPLRRLAHR